ncbi:Multicopper oxidase [Cryobacterium flavum]|uniref:Multicopper oxidase n=1 Tax=Cryobacterium flavum TaxID=1424659 RepID=A0A5E9FUS5_9MICO|nr:Multicopper oxidase [Cryobacterium flavum]
MTVTVSRRRVLTIGGLGLAATAIGAGAAWQLWPDGSGGASGGPEFVQPKELSSSAGELTVKLDAAPVRVHLRPSTVTARRELVFAMGMGSGMGGGMMTPTINGQVFSGDRVDLTVASGSVEEWTLRNDSGMAHPVHLHVWPVQIVEQNARAVSAAVWQDVVNVPPLGQVRVRIAFDDFGGRTGYHCHILDQRTPA